MMKRLKSALAVSAVVPIFAAGAAWAEEVTLRWGHYLGDSQYLQVEKDFAAAVEEATDGRVKIEITFAGGLGAGPELLTLTGRQAIDMAAIVPAYHPEQLLFWRAYQSPSSSTRRVRRSKSRRRQRRICRTFRRNSIASV